MAIRVKITAGNIEIARVDERGVQKGPEFTIPAVTVPMDEADYPNGVAAIVDPGEIPRFTAAVRSAMV